MSEALAKAWAEKVAALELELREQARGRAWGPAEARSRNDDRRAIKRDLAFAYDALAKAEGEPGRYADRILELNSADLFAA